MKGIKEFWRIFHMEVQKKTVVRVEKEKVRNKYSTYFLLQLQLKKSPNPLFISSTISFNCGETLFLQSEAYQMGDKGTINCPEGTSLVKNEDECRIVTQKADTLSEIHSV